MIRLSLVIATYNRAASLLDTLKSVVRQSAPSEQWECVVVNNNSSDNTADSFAEFVREYPDYNIIILDKLTYAGNLGNIKDIIEKIDAGKPVNITDELSDPSDNDELLPPASKRY